MHATIISCEQRTTARNLTLPQLAEFGIHPELVLSPCDPAGGRENARVSSLAIESARSRGESLLFMEDDLDFHWSFPTFLEQAQAANHLTYFYVHERPQRAFAAYGSEVYDNMKAGSLTPGLYDIRGRKYLFHTQAVFIPLEVLRMFDTHALRNNPYRNGKGGAFDEWLTRWLSSHRSVRALVALPNPVQHRHDRTARVQRPAGSAVPGLAKRSFSFDQLPKDKPAES